MWMGNAAQYYPSNNFYGKFSHQNPNFQNYNTNKNYQKDDSKQITAHFKRDMNPASVLSILKSIQKIKTNSNSPIVQSIFVENGAAFAILKLNISKRPVKLLIDTGASVSLLAADAIENNS